MWFDDGDGIRVLFGRGASVEMEVEDEGSPLEGTISGSYSS